MTASFDPHTDWAREDMDRERALAAFIAAHTHDRRYDSYDPSTPRLLDVLAKPAKGRNRL